MQTHNIYSYHLVLWTICRGPSDWNIISHLKCAWICSERGVQVSGWSPRACWTEGCSWYYSVWALLTCVWAKDLSAMLLTSKSSHLVWFVLTIRSILQKKSYTCQCALTLRSKIDYRSTCSQVLIYLNFKLLRAHTCAQNSSIGADCQLRCRLPVCKWNACLKVFPCIKDLVLTHPNMHKI